MASQSLVNESIFDLEYQNAELKMHLETIDNERDLPTLVGNPPSLYTENVPLWKQYREQLIKNLELANEVKKKLDEELSKF